MKAAQTFRAFMDEFGNPIPILPLTNSSTQVSISTGSNVIALPVDGVVFRLSAQADCWIKWGTDATVVAAPGDTLFLKGTEVVRPPANATHVAVISYDTSTGTLGITKGDSGDV